jgi:hypothetical protein
VPFKHVARIDQKRLDFIRVGFDKHRQKTASLGGGRRRHRKVNC